MWRRKIKGSLRHDRNDVLPGIGRLSRERPQPVRLGDKSVTLGGRLLLSELPEAPGHVLLCMQVDVRRSKVIAHVKHDIDGLLQQVLHESLLLAVVGFFCTRGVQGSERLHGWCL